MRENDLVQWLRETRQKSTRFVATGIGDDAAILQPTSAEIVVTTDLICDGVHFDSGSCTAAQIGHKAMAVNLSDIAAMAAVPMAAFVSLLLPKQMEDNYAQQIMAATMALANQFDCSVAGGDTNTWDGNLAINVLIIGHVTERGALTRSGARPGDSLLVTGTLGGSLSGHHLDFTPRINEAIQLNKDYELHAGMDLSDGLAMDLRRLCKESKCGAEIDAEALPISKAAETLSTSKDECIQRALGDGEDFELLLAVPPKEAKQILDLQPLDVPIAMIGSCTSGNELWLCQGADRSPLPAIGYEHQ